MVLCHLFFDWDPDIVRAALQLFLRARFLEQYHQWPLCGQTLNSCLPLRGRPQSQTQGRDKRLV